MKYLIILLTITLTSCAVVEERLHRKFANNIDLAKEDCTNMGYTPNTKDFLYCVQNVTNNLRAQDAVDRAAARDAANSAMPVTTTCHKSGSYVNCSSF